MGWREKAELTYAIFAIGIDSPHPIFPAQLWGLCSLPFTLRDHRRLPLRSPSVLGTRHDLSSRSTIPFLSLRWRY